jgi:hypothetical protein
MGQFLVPMKKVHRFMRPVYFFIMGGWDYRKIFQRKYCFAIKCGLWAYDTTVPLAYFIEELKHTGT